MNNRKKIAIFLLIIVVAIISLIFIKENKDNSSDFTLNIYHTTDLHSYFPNALDKYLDKIDNEKSLLLDAGDFLDLKTEDNIEWFIGNKVLGVTEEYNGVIREETKELKEGTAPIVQDLISHEYDAVAVGNHEFISYDSEDDNFTNLLDSFKEGNTELLSGNTFYEEKFLRENPNLQIDSLNRITKPYIIKNIETDVGPLKVGIIGGTTNTINEVNELVDDKLVEKDEVLLENNPNYKGKMYMSDLVEESIKISEELKENENPDLIVLLVHTGEMPKKPKHSGNRVQELAEKVPYIDVIIGGHTHKFIDENFYTGPNNKEVIYSQAGKHGEGIGNISIDLIKKDNSWEVVNSIGDNIKFDEDKSDRKSPYFEQEMKFYTEKEYKEMAQINDNIFIENVIVSERELNFENDNSNYKLDNLVITDDGLYLHYMKYYNYDIFMDINKEYNN